MLQILLIEDYRPDGQESMIGYAARLATGLPGHGFKARRLAPSGGLGSLAGSTTSGFGKWLGYLDKFLLFLPRLWLAAVGADRIHVCDHGNALYALVLPRGRVTVTCHDLLFIDRALGIEDGPPVKWTGRLFARLQLAGLARARAVVCVSEATRQALLARLGRDGADPRIQVVENALNPSFRPLLAGEGAETLVGLGLEEKRYFLHVGNNNWYKNRRGLLHLFAALRARPAFRDHLLVFAGKPLPAELECLARRLEIAEAVRFVGRVEDAELRALYGRASALLFPSLAEGFGWPIIEAQACATLVVTSDRAPMSEIAGRGAILIDPECPEAAADRIAHAWPERDRLCGLGLANVRRFTPERMLNGYASILRGPAAPGQVPAAGSSQVDRGAA